MSVLIGQTLDNHEIRIPLDTKKIRGSMSGIAPIHHATPGKQLKANFLLMVCFGYQCKPSKQKHLCKPEGLHQKMPELLPNMTVM